jgi:hypothetical protein
VVGALWDTSDALVLDQRDAVECVSRQAVGRYPVSGTYLAAGTFRLTCDTLDSNQASLSGAVLQTACATWRVCR